CIGDWHYNRAKFLAHTYMQPAHVINWMADAVSKNGTFILNIPGKPDGTIDADEQAVLDGIGNWMQTNGEAIYETRPWKVFGEGQHQVIAGRLAGNSTVHLDNRDIRFTRNKRGDTVYAIVLGPPDKDITIQSLGLNSSVQPGKVQTVDLLSGAEKLDWKQTGQALTIKKPLTNFGDYAFVLKVRVG
ncbi:MAG TPA: alpha-L-fucosidase, partial [Candidatus Acidoferrum sp.]|nr:alpha-L-fucosidase [Candidatus Acidoferrum sp.]